MAVAQAEDEYLGEHHVYRPHRAGLPPLGTYVRELARRRPFVRELARAELKAQNYNTAFGQAWLVLNPLLNAAVYFFLVDILSSGKGRPSNYITHLLAGIFAYTFFSGGVSQSAGSVVGGGKLILNTAFPRLLLPMDADRHRVLPVPAHAAGARARHAGEQPEQHQLDLLLTVPIFALLVLFTAGLGFICATLAGLQHRLQEPAAVPAPARPVPHADPVVRRQSGGSRTQIATYNPLSPIFEIWSDAIVLGSAGARARWLTATVYSVVLFVVGFVVYVSRERDYAVRI